MPGRLVLVRHAQAEPQHPRGDHERELTDAGVAAAVDLGRRLAQQGLAPDHVAVSTAARAVGTLVALRLGLRAGDGSGPGGEGDPDGGTLWQERRVYDGGLDGVLCAVRESPDDAATVWVVGHEPVMSTLTYDLSTGHPLPDALRQQLSSGFPTTSAAVLEVDGPWSGLGPGGARLLALLRGVAGA